MKINQPTTILTHPEQFEAAYESHKRLQGKFLFLIAQNELDPIEYDAWVDILQDPRAQPRTVRTVAEPWRTAQALAQEYPELVEAYYEPSV